MSKKRVVQNRVLEELRILTFARKGWRASIYETSKETLSSPGTVEYARRAAEGLAKSTAPAKSPSASSAPTGAPSPEPGEE